MCMVFVDDNLEKRSAYFIIIPGQNTTETPTLAQVHFPSFQNLSLPNSHSIQDRNLFLPLEDFYP